MLPIEDGIGINAANFTLAGSALISASRASDSFIAAAFSNLLFFTCSHVSRIFLCKLQGFCLNPPLNRLAITLLQKTNFLKRSSDSSDSSDSTDDEAEAEEVTREEAERNFHQEERFSIKEALEPLFKKSRRIVKWNLNHPEAYNAQGDIAKAKGLPWRRFERETACRWSSQLSMLESILHNNATMEAVRAAAEAKFPAVQSHDARVWDCGARVCGAHAF